MKITSAITEARARVRLVRHGKQWVVVGPYYPNKIDGPTMHSNPTDYWQARAHVTRSRANVALHLMGAWSYDAAFVAIETEGDLITRVHAGMRKFAAEGATK
jgi:hypothetical protein